MRDILRDSAVGQALRLVGVKRLLPFAEELDDFQLPDGYSRPSRAEDTSEIPPLSQSRDTTREAQSNGTTTTSQDAEKGPIQDTAASSELDIQHDIKGITLVTWYSDKDPENPHNYSFGKKMFISCLLMVYTVSCYIGSSLYTASEPDIMRIFGVSEVVAALGLSLYVIGYGVAPLLYGPLSEIPAIGRSPVYTCTYIIFTALALATALVDNFAGLMVLRFLLGFFAAPALANAGASYGDFFGGRAMPYVICLWGGGATLSPALGPLLSGFAVQGEGWQWSSWVLLMFAGPMLIVVLLFLPETSSDTILLRRARRLRALTGRADLKSESEMKQAEMSPRQVAFDALIKPWEINVLDPAVLFSTFYTALTYGLYYSFFESFPLAYHDIYGFNLGQLGLAFLSILIGLIAGVIIYCTYFYYIGDPAMAKMEVIAPEARLFPGLGASFLIPIGLFIFAWTVRKSIHWVVSLVGAGISMCGIFIIVQCMFIYLPFTYPRYSGSLFAANGFARSVFAAGAILFSIPMFKGLGIGGGVSLLGALTVLCIGGMFAIYFGGASLRKRSRFAG